MTATIEERAARAHCFDPNKRDDAEQEARIAVWQVSSAKPDAGEDYLYGVARRAVTRYAADHSPPFGGSRRAKHARPPEGLASLEGLLDDPGDLSVTALPDPAEHAPVRLAVASLPPLDREIARGVANKDTWREVAERVGKHPDYLRQLWRTRVAPALRECLA